MVQVSIPKLCDPSKCCCCLRIEVGVAFIMMCAFLDIGLLWYFVYEMYERSGLGYSIIFGIATIPQVIISYLALRWMIEDSGINQARIAIWMLINLPSKLVHGILLMVFAEMDGNMEQKDWQYWIWPTVIDLVVFGYFAWVVRQYVSKSQFLNGLIKY